MTDIQNGTSYFTFGRASNLNYLQFTGKKNLFNDSLTPSPACYSSVLSYDYTL